MLLSGLPSEKGPPVAPAAEAPALTPRLSEAQDRPASAPVRALLLTLSLGFSKLQADMKTTSLEEMRIVMETYYEEVGSSAWAGVGWWGERGRCCHREHEPGTQRFLSPGQSWPVTALRGGVRGARTPRLSLMSTDPPPPDAAGELGTVGTEVR